ncbi:MAG: type IV toxin-antitoxin system AbiEi family antitoxin domain-containing protein [Acidimicrobiia bacterium]
METDDQAVARLAARQHGIVAMRQAVSAGMTPAAVRHRVNTRRLLPLYPSVYRVAGSPVTWRSNVLAACLAAPGPGVASHRSAARLWDLPGGSERTIEITCRRWRRTQLTALVVHETLSLDALDVTVRDSIPCMTVERTLLSLGAASPASVELALDAALRRHLTSVAALRSLLDRLGVKGRPGAGVLRQVLDRHGGEEAVTESVMETRLKQLLRRHRLPMPRFQYEVRSGDRFVARVDAAYPDQKVAIEYDSYEHHTGHKAHVRDSRRRNALVGLGWSVISVTAADIKSGGDHVVAMIRAARSLHASIGPDMST